MAVTVVRTQQGWMLVAKDGAPVGWVQAGLKPAQ
jgi:hypothetical protein